MNKHVTNTLKTLLVLALLAVTSLTALAELGDFTVTEPAVTDSTIDLTEVPGTVWFGGTAEGVATSYRVAAYLGDESEAYAEDNVDLDEAWGLEVEFIEATTVRLVLLDKEGEPVKGKEFSYVVTINGKGPVTDGDEVETVDPNEPVEGDGTEGKESPKDAEISIEYPVGENGQPFETNRAVVNVGGNIETRETYLQERVFWGDIQIAAAEQVGSDGVSVFRIEAVPLEVGENHLRVDVHYQDEGGWSQKPIGSATLTVNRTEETTSTADSTTDAGDTGTTDGDEEDQAAVPLWQRTDTWIGVGAVWALLGLLGGLWINHLLPSDCKYSSGTWAGAVAMGPITLGFALFSKPSKTEQLEALKQEELAKRAAEAKKVEVKVDQPAEPPPTDEADRIPWLNYEPREYTFTVGSGDHIIPVPNVRGKLRFSLATPRKKDAFLINKEDGSIVVASDELEPDDAYRIRVTGTDEEARQAVEYLNVFTQAPPA